MITQRSLALAPIAVAGISAGLAGCGINPDPGGDISRLADDVAEDARDAAETAEELASDPEQLEREIERQKDSWRNGPTRIGK